MKKVSILCVAGLLFFAACDNSGSSTVGSYDKTDEPASNETKENTATEPEHPKQVPGAMDTTKPASADTSSTHHE